MNDKYVEHRYDGSEKPEEIAAIRPTKHGGKTTGYVVEFFAGESSEFTTDACGEFHSGTDAENRGNAELFLQAVKILPTAERLANNQIQSCHCYGKLCEYCDDARTVLALAGANDKPHYLKASYENGKLTDKCARCGKDFRDSLHLRVDDVRTNCFGHFSDCAVHNAPALPPGPCDCRT